MFKSTSENRLGKKKQLRLLTFFLGLATAAAFFIPFIVKDQGYFIFFGDFNVQQIPFYQYCHNAIRSGNFLWSWETDLGANFVGSYSFYLLGSPFFWLTLPFPNSFVPYLMGPLLILKFACASLTGYMFIRRFTARAESAMIGGLLYAFSGFSVYNIFFNHFHEAIVFFPLLLLAMEKFISEKKRGVLALAVFICALCNYYFFFGMVVFTVIYWVVRTFSGSFKFKISEFLLMLFECVLGLLLAAGILLPSILEIIQNSRLSSYITGWSALMYGKEQIFLNVIECFFFPPDLPARPVFFPGADVKWSSLGGWMPLFGMTGAITFFLSQKKGTWLRRSLVVFTIMALIPGLNAAFSLFNTSYYARWFFMPILLMALATAIALEDTEVNWDSAWRWSMGITLAFALVIGFSPVIEDGRIAKWGLYTDAATNPIKWIYQLVKKAIYKNSLVEGDYYDLRFWVTCLISILSLVILKILIPAIKEKKSTFFKPIIAFVCVISVIYASFFIACGQFHSYRIDDIMIDNLIEGKVSLDIDDDEFARIDVYEGVDNTGLYLGYPSINFFHSIVPSGVSEFYEFLGITRSVASRPSIDNAAIRPLLSVKYMLDPIIDQNDSNVFEDENFITKMPGYKYYGTQNGYMVYENQNYIPMGFTYDYYMTEEMLFEANKSNYSKAMLKAMLIDNRDVPVLSKYLKNVSDDYYFLGYEEGKTGLGFSDSAMHENCVERAKTAAYSFKYNGNSFTAKINLDRDNLVFFSVPFSDGWTAYVNGQQTEIYKVNKGFMAVVGQQGDCEIVFKYKTPGLMLGLAITIVSAVILLIYVAIIVIKRNIKPVAPADYPEGEETARRIALFEAANFAAENPENDRLLDDIDHNNINAYVGFEGGFTIDDSALDSYKTEQTNAEEGVDLLSFKTNEDSEN